MKKAILFLTAVCIFSLLGYIRLHFEEPEITMQAAQDVYNRKNLEINKGDLTSDGEIEDCRVNAININTASLEELVSLPSIGEKTARKIIEYRTENGGFGTIEDIMKVPGIGIKKFEQIKDMIKTN